MKAQARPLPLIRTYYDGIQSEISDQTALVFPDDEPSLTKQADMAACDINNIMARYETTGLVDHVNRFQGHYADLGDSVSYHDSLNALTAVQQAFDTLPAKIRTRFGNDPAQFLDFIHDPKNINAMVEMGLAEVHYPPAGVSERATQTESVETPAAPARGKKAVSASPPEGD